MHKALLLILFHALVLSGVEAKEAKPKKEPPPVPKKVAHAVSTLRRTGLESFVLQSPRGSYVAVEPSTGPVVADRREGDIRVREFEAGTHRITILETAGLRFVYLGRQARPLTDKEVAEIGNVDVLMLPVGGGAVLEAVAAHATVGRLKPKYLIVPMHYADIEPFRMGDDPVTKNFETVGADSYTLDPANLPKQPKIIVLDYK